MKDDLTLLGAQSSFFTNPDDAHLESFPNRTPGRPYKIILDTHEFSSLCPVTGQPDSCHLLISYVPAEKCVETKSLKYYLASYRNYPAFNEQIVNRIVDDLVTAINPAWLRVEGQFSPRGGIQLTTIAEHQPENRPL
ncbi:MAG: preQ(1) synthase [Akkermansia sp.]